MPSLETKQKLAWAACLALPIGLVYLWFENSLNEDVGKTVLQRIPSPDGWRTAVVTEVDGGATVNFAYTVTIEPAGKEALMVYAGTVRGKYGIETRWLNPNTLQVSFDHARFIRVGAVKDLKVLTKGKTDLP